MYEHKTYTLLNSSFYEASMTIHLRYPYNQIHSSSLHNIKLYIQLYIRLHCP